MSCRVCNNYDEACKCRASSKPMGKSAAHIVGEILNRFWRVRQSDTPEIAFRFVLDLEAAVNEAYEKAADIAEYFDGSKTSGAIADKIRALKSPAPEKEK